MYLLKGGDIVWLEQKMNVVIAVFHAYTNHARFGRCLDCIVTNAIVKKIYFIGVDACACHSSLWKSGGAGAYSAQEYWP